MAEESEILFERRGGLGLVTLNRPKALNALNLPMIEAFMPRLAAWAADPAVQAVAIRGAGGRAFCAGGDVRAVWQSAREGGSLPRDFFHAEYRLNYAISRFPKPYVALADGITMGGGVGLSAHGRFRLVTERTAFAMPETAIGLFPDVGGSHLLGRFPGQTGAYAALTGERLAAGDCMTVGYATHHLPADRLPGLLEALEVARSGEVAELLDRHATTPAPGVLEPLRPAIDRCFAASRVEDIRAALAAESAPDAASWAQSVLETLAKRSPTSLKITLEAVRRGGRLSLADALRMEYRLVRRCMGGHDFHEGIRAVLVDKDHAPAWRPDRLEAVDDATVARYFAPLDEPELDLADLVDSPDAP